MKNHPTIILLAVALTASTISTGLGQGTVVLQHIGANDPTTEGFILSLANGSVGPVTGDLGMDSWMTATPTNGISASYQQNLSASQIAQLAGENWTLTMILRVVETDTSGKSLVGFATGTEKFYGMFFGASTSGDPFVRINDQTYSLDGAGSIYNVYQLVYTAANDTADLWVNGVDRLQDVPHYQSPLGYVTWGSGLQSGPAQVNWNLVELSVSSVPEPSAICLIFLGLAGAASLRGVRWKIKRRNLKPLSAR
jgi:hypothetical protein